MSLTFLLSGAAEKMIAPPNQPYFDAEDDARPAGGYQLGKYINIVTEPTHKPIRDSCTKSL